MAEAQSLSHLTADLAGIGSGVLRDAALLSGLLIASAGAAGLNAVGAPVVRIAPNGAVAAVLLLDPCHVSIHSFPQCGMAQVDIFARDERATAKALDVFLRRLAPVAVVTDTRNRG